MAHRWVVGGRSLRVWVWAGLVVGLFTALGSALAAAAQGDWEPVVGGGAAVGNGFGDAANQGATAMAVFNGRLFVAASGDSGAPFVMRSSADGATWDIVTDDGFGDAANRGVTAMAVFNGGLYAGTANDVTGAEIWRTDDGVVWEQVNTDGFGSADTTAVVVLAVFNGQLIAGTENQAIGGAVYRSPDGTSWIPTPAMGGFGNPANRAVASLAGFGSRLYAGTFKESVLYNQPGELWWTENLANWFSDVAPGFGDPYNVAIVSLLSFDGYLFAGTSQLNFYLGNGCEVWRWDGQSWIMVNVPGFGSPQSTTAVRLAEHQGELYVGVDHQSSGAKVFRYLGPMSWLVETDDGFGDAGNLAIASLASFGSSLYAGTLNQAAGCEVWRQEGGLFADGFESGDTSAWSATVP